VGGAARQLELVFYALRDNPSAPCRAVLDRCRQEAPSFDGWPVRVVQVMTPARGVVAPLI